MLTRLGKLLLIKDTEYKQVIYFLFLFLLIGSGMALGRGTTDALFFKRYGIEYLPVMYVLLGLSLMTVSTVYAAFSDRIPAERFFKILFIGLTLLLVLNWLLMTMTQIEMAYPIYFLLYEIASELLLVHSTLYLTQNFDTLQAKRLTPLIFAGSQVGTILGGILLATFASSLGVQNMLLIWGGLLVTAMLVLGNHHRRHGTSPHFRPLHKSKARIKQSVEQVIQGIKFLKQSTLLRALSMSLFFMVITFYVLCYSVNRIYTIHFVTEEELTVFFGVLTIIYGSIALFLQIFVTNKLIQKFGVKQINLIFPCTTMVGFVALLGSFSLPMALLGSFNKDTLMPAFRNPVNNMFFNAMPNYMQGRARAMSVALVLPLALITTGILLLLAQSMSDPFYFLLIGLLTALFYLYFSVRMNRAYVAGLISVLREKVFLPDKIKSIPQNMTDADLIRQLRSGIHNEDDEICLAYIKLLISANPKNALDIIGPRLKSATNKLADQIIPLIAEMKSSKIDPLLMDLLEQGDNHLKAVALTALIDRNNKYVKAHIEETISSADPRLKAVGIYGVFSYPIPSLKPYANNLCTTLLSSPRDVDILAALDTLRRKPEIQFAEQIVALLTHPSARVVGSTLKTLCHWPSEETYTGLFDKLEKLSNNPDSTLRCLAIKCCHLLTTQDCLQLSKTALEDNHPTVRNAAANALLHTQDNFVTESMALILKNDISPRAQESLLTVLLDQHPQKELVEKIAFQKAQDALEISRARKVLILSHSDGPIDNTIELLEYVLKERLQQAIELALIVLEYLGGHETIRIIRAGLKSGDPRHIASAGEALRYIDNAELALLLSDLLEDIRHNETRVQPVQHKFKSARDVLDWCKQRSDPWLNQCATQVSQT